jgi:hypothetical protein
MTLVMTNTMTISIRNDAQLETHSTKHEKLERSRCTLTASRRLDLLVLAEFGRAFWIRIGRKDTSNPEPRANKRQDRSRLDLYKPRARSRIINGRGLLPDVDHRSTWVRRFRDVLATIVTSDLGGGDNCSEAEKASTRSLRPAKR